jgi:hypothetical protein
MIFDQNKVTGLQTVKEKGKAIPVEAWTGPTFISYESELQNQVKVIETIEM